MVARVECARTSGPFLCNILLSSFIRAHSLFVLRSYFVSLIYVVTRVVGGIRTVGFIVHR
jgi:hypothetical protein